MRRVSAAPATPRVDRQAGFTLVELLVAMIIGGLVLAALISVFTTALAATSKATDRLEAGQRGRQAIDRVTTLLDSQVCVGVLTPLVYGVTAPNITSPTSVTFYSDVGGTTFTPRKYRIYLDTDGALKEQRFDPTSTTAPYGWPSSATTPTSTRVIAANVTQTVTAGVTQPIFKYYGYTSSTAPDPTLALTATPTAVDITRAVRVGIKFTIAPDRVNGSGQSTSVEADSYSPIADPPDLTATPPDPYGGPGCTA